MNDTKDPDIVEHLPPLHPGEILLEDWVKPMGLKPYGLAKALGIQRTRVERIVRGVQPITADTALRLARFFGTSPIFWLRLQADYDLEVAERERGDEIARTVQPHEQAA
jgi:addiction module HigA family antidote